MEILHAEARQCGVNAKLVSNTAVKMQRKKKTMELQHKIENLWEQCDTEDIDDMEFIEEISKFMAFRID